MSVESSNDEAEFDNYKEFCDRCVARAQKHVKKDDHEFFFCNHHYNLHEDALVSTGWAVVSRVQMTEPEPELVKT